MWFKRKHTEYGCPMCGRLPKIIKDIIHRPVFTSNRYTVYNAPENTSLHAGSATLMTRADSGNNS